MRTVLDLLAAFLMIGGAAFCLIAAIGVYRLPDLLMRMHASTKAGTLGAGMLLLAVAVFFGGAGVATRALATIAFLVLTAPVAAHMIGRAGYYVGIELWPGTIVDALKEDVEKAGMEKSVDDSNDRQ